MSMDNGGYDGYDEEEEIEEVEQPSTSSKKSIRENIDSAKKNVERLRNTGNEKINSAIDKASNLEKKLAESAKNTRAGKMVGTAQDKINMAKDKVNDAGSKALDAAKNSKIGQTASAAKNTLGAAQDKIASGATKAAGKVAGSAAGKAVTGAAGKAAAGAAKLAGGVVPGANVAVAAMQAAKVVKAAATKMRARISGKSEEEIKQEKKKRRKIIIIVIALFCLIAGGKFAESEITVTDIDALITRRENRYGNESELAISREGESQMYKPLILFSNDEYHDMVFKDYTDDMCYVTMLKELYNGDVNDIFLNVPDIFEDVEGEVTEEKRYEVSGKNAEKYFKAEMRNFNKIEWYRYSNADGYNYTTYNENFENEEDLAENDVKPNLEKLGLIYDDVVTKKFMTSELMMPDFNKYDILPGGSEVEKGMIYVDMLAKYMQKWVIPFSILVDTAGDQKFCDNVVEDMYHMAHVFLYELYQNVKTTSRYYYLELIQRYTWDVMETESCGKCGTSGPTKILSMSKDLNTRSNSKDHKPGQVESKSESDLIAELTADFGSAELGYPDTKEKSVKVRVPDSTGTGTVEETHTHSLSYSVDNIKKTYVFIEILQYYTWDIVEKVFVDNLPAGETVVESKRYDLESKDGKLAPDDATEEEKTVEEMRDEILKEKSESETDEILAVPETRYDVGRDDRDRYSRRVEYGISNVVKHYEQVGEIKVATNEEEPDGMINEINVDRQITPFRYIPKLKYLEELYNIFNVNYRVVPINEENQPNYTNGADLDDVELNNFKDAIGVVTLKETWNENFEILDSFVKEYKVSYYSEKDYEKLGRRVSRIEWKQDWGPVYGALIGADSSNNKDNSESDTQVAENDNELEYSRASFGETNISDNYNYRVANIIEFNRNGYSLSSRVKNVTPQKQAFYDWIVPYAKMLQKEYGILASLTIAQKAQESGWDVANNTLAREANNFFGMKAGSAWTGDVYTIETQEQAADGRYYTVLADFRKYATPEDGFRGRGEFFWSNYSRYAPFLDACIRGNAEEAAYKLKECGYATSQTYATDLIGLIRYNDLTSFDNDPDYQYTGTTPTIGQHRPGESGGNGSNGTTSSGVRPPNEETPGTPINPGESGTPVNPYDKEPVCVGITNENYARRFEMYPEKTYEECVDAFLKYGDGRGYNYENLYFAFYQIDKYYQNIDFDLSGEGTMDNVVLAASGFSWPAVITSNNKDTAIVNALYGYTPLYGEDHTGIDISRGNVLYNEGGLSKGPKVVAAHEGTVIFATANPTSDNDDFTFVEIESTNGSYITRYGHLSEIHVTVGQKVKKGEVIGVMGTTGNSTGVHLHFEVFDNTTGGRVRVDPLNYFTVTPTYGSISRDTITSLPSGYRYIGGNNGEILGSTEGNVQIPGVSGGDDTQLPGVSGGIVSGIVNAGLNSNLVAVTPSWPADLNSTRINLISQGASIVQRVPYVFGGGHGNFNAQLANPTALDCSSFVSWCYAKAGLNFGDMTTWGLRDSGVFARISYGELLPGDVGLNANCTHTGIYIGKDSANRDVWMHAANSKRGIVIENYTSFNTFLRYKGLK